MTDPQIIASLPEPLPMTAEQWSLLFALVGWAIFGLWWLE